MLECVAFYNCVDFCAPIAVFTSDLEETAKAGRPWRSHLLETGKELKSSAEDWPLVEGLNTQILTKHTLEKCHLLDPSDQSGFEK